MNERVEKVLVSLSMTFWAVVAIVALFVIFIIAIMFYTVTPWPAPAPYPDVTVTKQEGAIGSYGLACTESYTTTVTTEGLEEYYLYEMASYCKTNEEEYSFQTLPISETWIGRQIVDIALQKEQMTCRVGFCPIRRFGLVQDFEVEICTIAPQKTIVRQVTLWKD